MQSAPQDDVARILESFGDRVERVEFEWYCEDYGHRAIVHLRPDLTANPVSPQDRP